MLLVAARFVYFWLRCWKKHSDIWKALMEKWL